MDYEKIFDEETRTNRSVEWAARKSWLFCCSSLQGVGAGRPTKPTKA